MATSSNRLLLVRLLLVRAAVCLGFLGVPAAFHAQPSEAQVPVALLPEPGELTRPTRAPITPRPLGWAQTIQLLQEEGITVPRRPPSQFSLTPSSPYRSPGGHVRVIDPPHWESSKSNVPTGIVQLDGAFLEISLDVKPHTRYVMDFTISGSSSVTVKQGCGGRGLEIGTFPLSQMGHVLVVVPTASTGLTCVRLQTTSQGWFYRVEVSELGPVP